jgi:hypothetical protein
MLGWDGLMVILTGEMVFTKLEQQFLFHCPASNAFLLQEIFFLWYWIVH